MEFNKAVDNLLEGIGDNYANYAEIDFKSQK